MTTKLIILIFIGILSTPVLALDSFSVMTFNIEGHPFTAKKKRFKRIAKKLKQSHELPDVIAFQESMTRHRKVIEKAANYPFRSSGPKAKGYKINSGLVVLSKHPIVSQRSYAFKNCAKLDCFVRKGVLHTRIKITGTNKNVDFYTSHFQASKSGGYFTSRKSTGIVKMLQTNELIQFIKRTHNPNNALVMAGDFNFTSSSDYFKDLITIGGMKSSLEWCIENSCDGADDSKEIARKLIDHHFFTSPKGQEIVPTYFDQSWREYKLGTFSDHHPVLVKYKFIEN